MAHEMGKFSLKTLKRPSLSLFSGGVSSWKKSLYDLSWTSKKSGYSTKFLSLEKSILFDDIFNWLRFIGYKSPHTYKLCVENKNW